MPNFPENKFTVIDIYLKDKPDRPIQVYRPAVQDMGDLFCSLTQAELFCLECCLTSRKHFFNMSAVAYITEHTDEIRVH